MCSSDLRPRRWRCSRRREIAEAGGRGCHINAIQFECSSGVLGDKSNQSQRVHSGGRTQHMQKAETSVSSCGFQPKPLGQCLRITTEKHVAGGLFVECCESVGHDQALLMSPNPEVWSQGLDDHGLIEQCSPSCLHRVPGSAVLPQKLDRAL